MQKKAVFKTKGMQRDLSASAFTSEYSYENKNIRITATDDNTLLSIINEKGNAKVTFCKYDNGIIVEDETLKIIGTPIGRASINEYLVLFTHDNVLGDFIYSIKIVDDKFILEELYKGNLSFSTLNPIETLASYENNEVIKVYWVDGLNQPRVINIVASDEVKSTWSDKSFDFIQELQLNEDLEIEKQHTSGSFSSGVIQYAFNYYNKNGQETNIVEVSPINYISYEDRGGSAEDVISNSFKITINNPDINFDYLRLYSIHRTSLDATPTVKLVTDISTKKEIIIDTTEANLIIDNSPITIINTSNVDYTITIRNYNYNELHNEIPETVNAHIKKTQNSSNITIIVRPNVELGAALLSIKDNLSNYGLEIITHQVTITPEDYSTINPEYGFLLKQVVATRKHSEFIENIIEYIDTGITGEIIDPVELLYKGGEYIVPKTLTQKDGTLFLGNIEIKNNTNTIDNSLLESWREQEETEEDEEGLPMFAWQNNRKIVSTAGKLTGYYPYKAYLNSGDSTSFKSRETYRLGIQFQDKTGKWSEPIKYNDLAPSETPKMIGTNYYGVTAGLRLSKDINDWAINNGYIKVRPVVVYPLEGEREVVAQGIVNSTLSKIEDRLSRDRTHQSSWFFRPNVPDYDSFYNDINVEYGAYPAFKHGYPLPSNNNRNAEIQSTAYNTEANLLAYRKSYANYPNCYVVDKSVVTFHSPEIELEDTFNYHDLKFRIVGYSTFDTNMSDISIICNPGPICLDRKYFFNGIKDINYELREYSGRGLISGLFWKDGAQGASKDSILESDTYKQSYLVYPWHGDYINNQKEDASVKYSILKEKKMSNLKLSVNTSYLNEVIEYTDGITQYCDGINKNYIPLSNKVIFEEGTTPFDYYTYDSNIDTLLTWPVFDADDTTFDYFYYVNEIGKNRKFHLSKGFPIITNNWTKEGAYDIEKSFDSEIGPINIFPENDPNLVEYSKSPIRIKYKSSPHAVIYLGHSTGTDSGVETTDFCNLNMLPVFNNESEDTVGNPDINNIKIKREQKKVYINQQKPYLWVAELYREVVNKFGGDSTSSNLWYPAGKSKKLILGKETLIEFTQGDTFFARFDSLKTYPYTLQDTNSIVEIGSFMVETRINLDARYDRNRGKQSNLVMTPNNFNLFNDVYNQRNNFFNYRIKDEKYGDVTYFPNLITYTKTKTAGELVDTWTNITLASTLDLDGDKGELRALRRLNNNILAFQDTGISQILYNENVQIASTEGVPIEIANSGKVTGKRYLSDKIGCTNKWSICETPSGLYFIDDITKGIYLFNGQLTNISDSLGFSSWINKNSKLSIWNPEYFSNFITYYDKVNGEVLFVNKDECLAFSEVLKQFTSFYSYEGMYFFTNLKGKGIAFKDKDNNNEYSAWVHNEGDYNKFFDEYQPFYTTLIVNPNMTSDKIFNNIEFRSDTWEWNTVKKEWELSNITFDTLEVWNEYQRGKSILVDEDNKPSNLKRKFRIWRANIPRDESNGRDRMRNPWLYLKLSMNNKNTNKTILHDITVDYFE